MYTRTTLLRTIALLIALTLFSEVHGQTAPSPQEVAQYTGLHLAAHHGKITAIEQLVSTGANINARDNQGRAPVHIAAFASQAEALRALAKAGANMNALDAQHYDVVTIAAVANDAALMSLAIELGNDPGLITSPYEGTALIAAAHLGHHEIVRRLIAAGAPLDHVNNLGWTALIEAVILGDGGPDHQATVSALIAAGADRSISDRDGVIPLEHARIRGYDEIARLIAEGP